MKNDEDIANDEDLLAIQKSMLNSPEKTITGQSSNHPSVRLQNTEESKNLKDRIKHMDEITSFGDQSSQNVLNLQQSSSRLNL